MDRTFAIVLAGGRNERLWPLARAQRPKALLRVDGRSLLSGALDRVERAGIPAGRTIIVGSRQNAEPLSREAPARLLVLEPDAGDTARAVALGALRALELAEDPILCVVPSDHLVPDPEPMAGALRAAVPIARRHRLFITFGTAPRGASTAYGWLRPGEDLGETRRCHLLSEYVEKPDAKRAEDLWRGSRCLWNSGTFVLPAGRLVEAYSRFLPEAIDHARAIAAGREPPPSTARVSLDHGILEPATRAGLCAVMPIRYDRRDVGRLDGMADLWDRDVGGNATRGDVVAVSTSGSLLAAAEGTVLAALDLADLAIVAERDVVLVCPRERAADVREMLAELRARGRGDLL